MPYLARAALGDAVIDAIQLLGTPTSVAILGALMRSEPLTAHELEQQLDSSSNTLKRHLAELRTAGLVLAEPIEDPDGRGSRLQFRIDRAELTRQYRTLGAALGLL